MATANKALTAKRAEKAGLQKVKTVTVTITIEASELSFQRLAALLTLEDPTRKPLPTLEELGPLPFDEQPARNDAPLDIDYDAVRRKVVKHFEAYVAKYSREKLEQLIQSYGALKVSSVSDEQVLGLLAEMEAALA